MSELLCDYLNNEKILPIVVKSFKIGDTALMLSKIYLNDTKLADTGKF